MAGDKFIVITPARNEEKYIGKTIESMVAQTILPTEWVIVDDGSTDKTYSIAESASRIHPWIKVIQRPDRGFRDFSGPFVELIYEGLNNLTKINYKYIFKVDADVILKPNYFERILAEFAENPELGIAGGVVYDWIDGKKFRVRSLPEFIPGAIKGWRRECFEEMGGLVKGLGWEGFSAIKAIMLGWQTKTCEDEAVKVLHLRPERSSIKNIYHGWARHGKALHFIGAHPVWLLASAIYHLVDRPVVLGSLCMIIGYLDAVLQGSQQYEDKTFKTYYRAYQKKRLRRILRLQWMPEV
jgi:biofilm PGA synthesis N-glycosyltransferase PgaC